ncbi:glycerol-3-phosphate 1-O-acyltransferase PlsY [Mycoplasmopsis cynos]|uniref:glycerol-3-phosphate 1-O-acyltransferase PlsY n=1 Tax=Mycoplasmopsis cynos TaxID=171284 RepID=UPI002AFE8F01|nr:glycerol-3-phosphate 1-O-acyltransferase PlsY [Mycoplasmopsis cynos]WQQ14551.1 glycerol-3-phosphate 1-O-acyltransferase PlsY [Mycoplasmopsis cynos]
MEFFLTIFINVGFFLIGYLIGSINTSIVFSKIFNKPDLREYYSKNAGATNSLRVYGTKSAVFILLIDIFKTFTMVLICRLISYGINSRITPEFIEKTKDVSLISNKLFLIPLLGGLGVVIGNIYPIFYNFKGGKGVATSLGFLISINIVLLPIASVFFFGLMFWKRYVSLASIVTAFVMIFFCAIPWISEGPLGWITGLQVGYFWVTIITFGLAATFLIYSHKENIKRLLNKCERKFGVN